jgi:hypothetical protein
LFVADYDDQNDMILDRALQVMGFDRSFMWEHEGTGRLWDRWPATTLEIALESAKTEASYLHMQLGHCAFVVPKIVRVRAILQPPPFRTAEMPGTNAAGYEAVVDAWMRSQSRGVHQS